MIEAMKSWFFPDSMSRKEKIERIRQRDKEISEKMAIQLEELEDAIESRKCKKSSQ